MFAEKSVCQRLIKPLAIRPSLKTSVCYSSYSKSGFMVHFWDIQVTVEILIHMRCLFGWYLQRQSS